MLTSSFWINPLFSAGDLDKTHVVQKFEEFRPDVVSLEIYGSDSYGPHIMVYNGITDPFKELSVGTVLKYPPFDQLSKVL